MTFIQQVKHRSPVYLLYSDKTKPERQGQKAGFTGDDDGFIGPSPDKHGFAISGMET